MDFLEFLKFFDNEKNSILLLEKSFDFFWKNYPNDLNKMNKKLYVEEYDDEQQK